MVKLTSVLESNLQIPTLTPQGTPGLVAVFPGATSGIGEATLKEFAKHANKPKVYFLGRNQDAGDRIAKQLKEICPEGQFTFIKADLSLIKNVDEVSARIKSEEQKVNLLFLTAGFVSLTKEDTSEGLEKVSAIGLYSRIRLMQNFLPHLQQASPGLARIVNVFAGGHGGVCDENDLAGRNFSALKLRTATSTMTTMAMEHLAAQAPEVSFLHMYPGIVRTPAQDMPGLFFFFIRAVMYVFGRWICIPVEESGQRSLYQATSRRFPPKSGGDGGVTVPSGLEIAETPEGSGVYLVNWDGEVMKGRPVLAEYRANGMREKIWKHIEDEFKRIEKL